MAPPRVLKDEGVLRWWRSVSDHVADPRHAGSVGEADRVGEAKGSGNTRVTVGVWLDRLGRVRRARWTSSPGSDALVAYAETACALLESGVAPASVDADSLRRTLSGVAAGDQRLADVVASAVGAALCSNPLR